MSDVKLSEAEVDKAIQFMLVDFRSGFTTGVGTALLPADCRRCYDALMAVLAERREMKQDASGTPQSQA